ncbi:MAG TPA: zinc ribbon domain-containing protein [Chloroflexia bacterium]|jgi:hypothetical protein
MNCSNCGFELAETDRFCRKCGTPRPTAPVDPRFKSAEDEYFRLKGQLTTGRLNSEDFKVAIQGLMVKDAQGRYWMLNEESGDWLVNDGSTWVPGDPHSSAPPTQPIAPAPAPTPTHFSPPPQQPQGTQTTNLYTQPLPPPMPQPMQPPPQQWQPPYNPNPYSAPPPTQQWQAQPPVAQQPVVYVQKKKSRAGCCVGGCLLVLVGLCGGVALLYFLIQNGTITQRQILNTLGLGTGEVNIMNLLDGNLSVTLEPVNTGTPDPYSNSSLTVGTAESDAFVGLSPGRYKLSFTFEADGTSSECTIKVDSGDNYRFVAVPEGVGVFREKEAPQSSDNVNVSTSPLCQR